jgi:hypothetical protein
MSLVVYLDSGVTVDVPPGTDAESDAGRKLVKAQAKEKLLALLNSDDFDIQVDEDIDLDEMLKEP